MAVRVKELIQQSGKQFTKKRPLDTLHQILAENFYPIRADFTRPTRAWSEEFASYLMSGRPVLAHRDLSNAISSILRPKGMQWLKANVEDDDQSEDLTNRQWLDRVGKRMRGIYDDRNTQFTRATTEGDADYVLTGQCVIEVRMNMLRNNIVYRTHHLRDCAWLESGEGEIDHFWRKQKMEARTMCRLFPKTVHPKVKKACEKDPFCEYDVLMIVMPAEEYDSFGKSYDGVTEKRNRNLAFVSIIIDTDNEQILEETQQPELGYVIPRWVTIGGWSQYAYSPSAIIALPDGRMLQMMTLTLLEVGQKIVDPPLKAVGDAVMGSVNFAAGDITWVDPDYDERTGAAIEPMIIPATGLKWGTEYVDKIEGVLSEAFYLNVLNMPQFDGKVMTAEEYRGRMQQYIRQAQPLFGPMDGEYNGRLCSATFNLGMRMGMFGSVQNIPRGLQGQDIKWKFSNPLVAAEDEVKTASFTKLSQLLAGAMQLDKSLIADVDLDVSFRDAVPGTGAPSKWIRGIDDANKLKAQQRQQEQAAATANQVAAAADTGSKVGDAAKNIGDAAQSMQTAGML